MSTNRDGRHRTPRDSRQKEKPAVPAWATEPNSPRALGVATLAVGGSMAVVLLIVVALMSGVIDDLLAGPAPTEAPVRTPIAGLAPPAATPLADPPDEPAGDGTIAIIETEFGDIEIELFTESSPVAAENFINLARAGYYDGVIFHRVIPNFVIQGGDPDGTGTGGPGYTILDEPVVGEYGRAVVAMARVPNAPNSAGSQFFIVLADAARPALDSAGDYQIFGVVTEGMDVVDEIAAQPTTGSPTDRPLDPVVMISVTIE
jgi:peptidyl-prolyl cis-trans isomerase B (cyclophilin B)